MGHGVANRVALQLASHGEMLFVTDEKPEESAGSSLAPQSAPEIPGVDRYRDGVDPMAVHDGRDPACGSQPPAHTAAARPAGIDDESDVRHGGRAPEGKLRSIDRRALQPGKFRGSGPPSDPTVTGSCGFAHKPVTRIG
jgi:hypothetical protein